MHSLEDLRRVGVLETWSRCALAGHPVSVTLAYALEAALRDIDWRDLDDESKAKLRENIFHLEQDYPGL